MASALEKRPVILDSENGTMTSPRCRILNLEPEGYCEEAQEVIESIGDVSDGPLSRQALLDQVSDYEIMIVRLGHQIDREVIKAGRKLKAIVSATTGLDHIDLEAARAQNVTIISLRGEETFLRSITATAEHTCALLLALMRRIPEAVESVRSGQWDRDSLKGRDLADKRLGIVGLGRVGRQVAGYGAAFKMEVAAYDPHVTDWLAIVQRKNSLQDLLAESDVLSLHVNLHPGTLNLIGKAELAWLPPGSVLINTSRGEVVDEEALTQALVSGHLQGAAVDVLHHERSNQQRQSSPLMLYAKDHHNLLMTPHLGGATCEAMKKTEIFMAQKLAEFVSPWRRNF